jgi:hypothetical protein
VADPKNVIVDIKNGLSDVRQQMNLLKQDTAGWVSSLSSGVSRMSSGGSGSGGGGVSNTLLAPNPKFALPAGSTVGGSSNAMVPYQPMGGNISANTPPINPSVTPSVASNGAGGGGYTGNTNLTRYIGENPAAGALYAASLTSGMLDQPGESVESQLLTSRASYFNNFKNVGSAEAYKNMKGTIGDLSDKATITNKMDVQRGLAAAQSMGVSGPNITQAGGGFGSVAGGVASASNLIPGQGFEGTMRAFGSMQQGRNVNMLRGIGIQIRDADGNMKPPDQIIDDLWKKICRDYAGNYGAGKKPSKREMQIGLQPGNSMDSMLDMYFGNDPMAKQLVANGLLFKAETGGEAISKEKLQELGATTEAVEASSNRASKSTKQTLATQDAGAKGYTEAANLLASLSEKITKDMLGPLQKITQANAYIMTLLGGANDVGSKALTAALGLGKGKLAGLGILATAGVAAGVVGLTDLYNGDLDENGPFGKAGGTLPKTDGKVASKNAKDTVYDKKAVGGLSYGGTANNIVMDNKNEAKGQIAFAKALLQELDIPQTPGAIESLVNWQKQEGGHWRNSAAYNPLNTKYDEGAVSENKNGIKAYADWEGGVSATAKTLTGNMSKERGYDNIISALKGGDPQIISAAILASDFVGKGVTNKAYEGFAGAKGTADSGKVYNYGGVTLKIEAAGKSAQQLFDEFKRLLENEEILKGAVTK